MIGYVYIMINTAFPDLIKIGRTVKKTEDRASELYTTGTPGKFIVIYELLVDNCIEIEKKAHELLADKRFSENREFFKVSPKEAIDLLKSISEERIIEEGSLVNLESENHDSIFEGELVKYYLYCVFIGYKNKKYDDKSNIYRFGLFTIDKYEDIVFDGGKALKKDSWDLNIKNKFELKESISKYYSAYEHFNYTAEHVRFAKSSDMDLIHSLDNRLLNKNYKNKLELLIQKEINEILIEKEDESPNTWSYMYDEQTLISKYTQGWDDNGASYIYMSARRKLLDLIQSVEEKSIKAKEAEKVKNIKISFNGYF